MRALYVGQPGTDRAGHWTTFLSGNLTSVSVASLTDLGALDFTGIDLVIVDGDTEAGPQPPAELTDAALPLPTVLIGAMGGRVSDAIGLKLGWDWGCRCLNHQAIIDDATPAHPIFTSVPQFTTQVIGTPANFLEYVAKTVPPQLTVADIHAAPPEGELPGLVSTSAGFLDSPDCEHILGGINMKAHDYNAVARQARFLQWGFHDAPSSLTELGKALFVNCLHYILSYGGAPVEALRVQWSRDTLPTTLGFLDHPMAPEPKVLLASAFGSAIPDGIGATAESALAWYDRNRGYLRREGTHNDGNFMIDEDLVALGLANDDPALVETLAVQLDEEGADGERARRLWQRYVRRPALDAAAERAWLAKHRDRMFFSDWAGYRWIARDDLPVLTIPRMSAEEAGPAYLWPTANRVGDDLRLVLHIMLRPGFYVYAPGASDGIATTIEVVSAHTVVEPPAFPESDDFHLYGEVKVPLTVRGEGNEVELAVRIQACDEQSCTPPTTVEVRAVAGD
ncbi:protein-disulfide reductase DsbD domain-containing protein [Nonomuraea angiospora]|uniref:protein-disulfide reductase DsbD domain-containing protein n=1 Tax=Nonomuraea angiospora TaxID=46172 RepID=UPI00331C043A